MEQIRRILCPTDFSGASNNAFQYCERLAASSGAEIVLLHVYEVPDFWGTGGREHALDPEIKKQLTSLRPTSQAVRVEYVAHGGQPGEVICWLAQQRGCELIVMGTHGRTGLTHALLGSVAEYVVRHARCPVLTVRDRPHDEPPLKEPEVHLPAPPLM